MVYLIIIILLTAADQGIKYLVVSRIGETEAIPVIDSFFYLVNRRNSGAAWSFLADQAWGIYALAAVSAIASLVMLVILFRTGNRRLKACLSVIVGGSIGNLIDRVRLLSVTDYLDFHFGSYVFPTFNLADMLVVCGTLLLCLLLLTDPSILDGAPARMENRTAEEAGQSAPENSDNSAGPNPPAEVTER